MVVIIVILLIIAAITVYEGKDIIEDVKVETLETSMLGIKAKAKSYAEEIEAEIFAKENANKADLFESKYKMMKIINYSGTQEAIEEQIGGGISSSNYDAYEITEETLEIMSLYELKEDIKNNTDKYIVVYNTDDYTKIDVIYTPGIMYENSNYYTLSALQNVYDEK